MMKEKMKEDFIQLNETDLDQVNGGGILTNLDEQINKNELPSPFRLKQTTGNDIG